MQDFLAAAAVETNEPPATGEQTAAREYINSMLFLKDLDRALPRDKLPELVDGRVHFYSNNEVTGQRDIVSVDTQSASRAESLLAVIDFIREGHPDFFEVYFDGVDDAERFNLIVLLHLAKEERALQEALLLRFRDHSVFYQKCEDLLKELEGNTHYPFDDRLQSVIDTLVDCFVIHKLPKREADAVVDDHQVQRIIDIANLVTPSEFVIHHVTQNAPIPQSVHQMHRDVSFKIQNLLFLSSNYLPALKYASENFARLGTDEKRDVSQKILDLLSEAYGVSPPPQMSDFEGSALGNQKQWSAVKEECFAHPLGMVKVDFNHPEIVDSFEGLCIVLCHEFTHGLEDMAMISLNPDFQRWHRQSGEKTGVKCGGEKFRKAFSSLGFLSAFNVASKNHSAFNGDGLGVPYVVNGRYNDYPFYIPDDAPPERLKDKKFLVDRHKGQFIEIHAYRNELTQATEIKRCLKYAALYQDPMKAFLAAQNIMFRIEEFFRKNEAATPEGKIQSAQEMAKAREFFKRADRRDATMLEKVDDMIDALVISGNCLVDCFDCTESKKLFSDIFIVHRNLHIASTLGKSDPPMTPDCAQSAGLDCQPK